MTISDKAAVQRRINWLQQQRLTLKIRLNRAERYPGLWSADDLAATKREIAKVEQQLKELGQ